MEISKGAVVVDQVMKTNLHRVWACGDITTFEGKLKLIATGFAESAVAVAQAVHSFRPEMRRVAARSRSAIGPPQGRRTDHYRATADSPSPRSPRRPL